MKRLVSHNNFVAPLLQVYHHNSVRVLLKGFVTDYHVLRVTHHLDPMLRAFFLGGLLISIGPVDLRRLHIVLYGALVIHKIKVDVADLMHYRPFEQKLRFRNVFLMHHLRLV